MTEGVAARSPAAGVGATALPWLNRPPLSSVRALICFPHGGAGSSAYDGWAEHVAPDLDVIAVRPPGRAHRLREPPIADLDTLADAAYAALAPHLRGSYALFGHCIGALVAFEVALRIQRFCGPPPLGLFVSGYAAPCFRFEREVHDAGEAELLASVRALGGLTDEQLADPGFLCNVLPALRADCTAAERHRVRDPSVLSYPIVALGGAHDELVSIDRLLGWQRYTTHTLRAHVFPGGHFYHREQLPDVLATVAREIDALSASAHSGDG